MRRGSESDRNLDFAPLAPDEGTVIVKCSGLADLHPLVLRGECGEELLESLVVVVVVVLALECDGEDSDWLSVNDVNVILSGAHRSELGGSVQETHCPVALVLHQQAIFVSHVAEVELDWAGHGDFPGINVIEKLVEGAVDAPHILQPKFLTFEFGSPHAGVRFQFDVSGGGRGDIADWQGGLLLQVA